MPSPTFAASDLSRAERAIQTLLSPLDYPTLDDWRRQATRDVKALVGADVSAFVLPEVQGMPEVRATPLFSEETPDVTEAEYFEAASEAYVNFDIAARLSHLRVGTLAEHLGSDLADWKRTPYVHEFLQRMHCFDSITVAGSPQYVVTLETTPHLHLHKSRPGELFTAKDAALARLVYPAFEAGIGALRRTRTRRQELLRTLDTLGDGALLVDARGRTLHTNSALTALSASDPEMSRVEVAMQRLAQDHLVHIHRARRRRASFSGGLTASKSASLSGLPLTVFPERQVTTASARYLLRATLLGEDLMGRAPAVLVVAERLTAQLPSRETLRERFELTERQAQVALLIAEGMPDKAIAERLGIRLHTARNHTRRVLEKLGIQSRTAVRPVIMR